MTRAAIFVHGFGGDACDTWANFHLLIDDLTTIQSWSTTTDFFFFHYHSVWERIDSSVDRLQRFLDAVVPTPDETHFRVPINPILVEESSSEPVFLSPFPASRRYEKVILIGHSEGGVVIRKAILDASRGNRTSTDSVLSSNLALFAPAIFGFNPSGFLGILATMPGLGRVLEAVLTAAPAYQDLKNVPEILAPLQKDTEALASQKPYSSCQASILWSRQDWVVSPGRSGMYSCDLTREYIDGYGHTSMCRPTENYIKPIELVKSLG